MARRSSGRQGVAGYVNDGSTDIRTMRLTPEYDSLMERAVRGFQQTFGLQQTGVIDDQTKAELDRQVEPDGSTVNFDFSEFADIHAEWAPVGSGV